MPRCCLSVCLSLYPQVAIIVPVLTGNPPVFPSTTKPCSVTSKGSGMAIKCSYNGA